MPDYFLDTCIFLAYAYPHDNWNAECVQFFNANYQRFTGKRVESELNNRLNKRRLLYIDLAAHLGRGGTPEEFVASIEMNPNDRRHFVNLLGILKNMPKADILTYVRDKDQVTRKGISEALRKVQNPLIGRFYDPNCEDLIFALIGNRMDAQILVDALRWSDSRPSSIFLTLDGTDIVRHRMEIIEAVCRYKMRERSPMEIYHIKEII